MKVVKRILVVVALMLCLAPAAIAAPFGQGLAGQGQAAPGAAPSVLDASVVDPPSPVLGTDGRRHLVYEMLLENPTSSAVTIEVVQAFDALRRSQIAAYAGPTLDPVMFRATATGLVPGRTLQPGEVGIILLDVAQRPADPVPQRLEHRFVLFVGPASQRRPAVVTAAPTPVDLRAPVRLGAPLHGPNLFVLGCCGVPFAHRLALLEVDGGLFLAQRYAIDFVRLDSGINTFSGDPSRNSSYFVYGAEVVAVAAGRVAATRDGMAENTPPNVPPNGGIDDAAGNFVNQDLGGGRFALYAHLQPGSLRVRPGDTVRPGQVIGLVGNSGNSSEPHLHFHVMDGPGGQSNLGANGLPYVFDRFRLTGRVIGLDGTTPFPVRVPVRPSERTGQYPLTGDILAFP